MPAYVFTDSDRERLVNSAAANQQGWKYMQDLLAIMQKDGVADQRYQDLLAITGEISALDQAFHALIADWFGISTTTLE